MCLLLKLKLNCLMSECKVYTYNSILKESIIFLYKKWAIFLRSTVRKLFDV